MSQVAPQAMITATGRFLPENVLTNFDLEKMVDTSDAWIRERTGISERRIAPDGMSASYMGERAASQALERAELSARDVDLLLVSTETPDYLLPSTACAIQSALGASSCYAMDLRAACSGFLYGLSTAEAFVATGQGDVALLVSTEKMSSITNWNDRASCVLFGDGAGAVVVQASRDGRGVLSSYHRSDGSMADLLMRRDGGAERPITAGSIKDGRHLLRMEGKKVFKSAVRRMAQASRKALEGAGLAAEDIQLMVPHQANLRIIDATAKYARIPDEKVFVNLGRYGNISSATIPVAMDEAAEQGRLEPGSHVLCAAFGAGLTWGAAALRW